MVSNLKQLKDARGWAFHQSLADTYDHVVKYHGLGNRFSLAPQQVQLWVSDPKALQYIVLKEQDVYEESERFIHQHRLADMDANKLRGAILAQVATSSQEIDVLHWFSRTALELVGQSGLGYSFDNLDDGAPHPYTLAMKNLVPTIFRLEVFVLLLPYLTKIGPRAFRRAVVELYPSADVQSVRKMVDLMADISREILHSKQQGSRIDEQVGGGKDIMSILLRANREAAEEDRLTDAELIGQVSSLTFAATDTTSSALARLFHLLAQYPDVQNRLRDEICASRSRDGDLDYKELDGLPYLDAVIRETLRLSARKDTMLPLSRPIVGLDGTHIYEIPVPNGTRITVAIMRANRDPDIWGEDAQEWKPERWLAPLPDTVLNARIPGVYSNLSVHLVSLGAT
ncbi:hypothetical protein HWV62_11119 [Athelia sp. TMB]|nr:hypothetical protein HWV62_18786 [Athelia sp. TMB]KAF7974867.1 hypothetical protein HWV62_11119 [Athelia sp. TMB]